MRDIKDRHLIQQGCGDSGGTYQDEKNGRKGFTFGWRTGNRKDGIGIRDFARTWTEGKLSTLMR